MLKPVRGRLHQPRAAADEQRVGSGLAVERIAAEPVGKLGALAQVGALELGRFLRFGGAADQLRCPNGEESRELPG